MQKNAQIAEQDGDLAHPDGMTDRTRDREAFIADQASLAGRLRQGDRTAAEELVEKSYERVYLFMRAMGHDRQTSEDLTQETFLKAWNHIGQLRDGNALNGWLFRIAANVSRLFWRKHRHDRPVQLDAIEPRADGVDGSRVAGDREQFARLHTAVGKLPWKLRQAVVLHYMGQLSIAQAAEAADIREGTLKSRLNRALEALRQELIDE